MVYLLILLIITIGFLGRKFEKTWLNFLTLFSFMWAFILFAANLELFEMNQVSGKAYVMVGLGCFSYAIGYLSFRKKPFYIKIHKQKDNIKSEYRIRNHVFIGLFILTLLVWSVLFASTLKALYSGLSYSVIRDIYAGTNKNFILFPNRIFEVICKWFFVPSVYVVLAKILYTLFKKPMKKIYYLGAVLLLLFYCFATGSRQILLILIVQLIFLAQLSKFRYTQINLTRKIKRIIRVILFLSVLGIGIITLNRTQTQESWTTEMTYYAYASIAMPIADHWMQLVDNTGFYTYGFTFLRGILLLIARFGIPLPDYFYESSMFVSFFSDTYIPIFGQKVFNAFTTIFFYFYVDFGFFGVVLGSLFFGILSAAIYTSTLKNTSEYHTIIFLLFLISVVKSFARWEFAQPDYVAMFVIARVMYGKVNVKCINIKKESL